jgi:hypothetical protein
LGAKNQLFGGNHTSVGIDQNIGIKDQLAISYDLYEYRAVHLLL